MAMLASPSVAPSVAVRRTSSPLVALPARPLSAAFRPALVPSSEACVCSSSWPRSARLVAHAKGGKGKGGQQAVAVEAPAKGGKGGKGGKSDDVGDADVAKIEKEAKADAEDRMKKALVVLGENFNTIRTGRANPAILDRIMVDYFGESTPLKNVAAISVPESSTLMLTPFDKSALKDIERAINESDLGINPNNDGERIRLSLPQLTQDRRKELVKNVAKMGEEGKVAVRNVRKDVMKKIDKYGDAFSKDAKKALEDAIQKFTDIYVKKVDDAVKAKSDELLKL